jgi:hypothetical protein
MQYFAVCDNPFSAGLEKKLRDKLSKDYSTKKAHIELLQIDDVRHDINLELKKYDLEIENICIFYYKSMVHNEIHIDLYNNHVINSSLAIPWILNDSYHVYWVTGNYKFTESRLFSGGVIVVSRYTGKCKSMRMLYKELQKTKENTSFTAFSFFLHPFPLLPSFSFPTYVPNSNPINST